MRYRNAFNKLWEDTLSKLSNNPEDIAQTLEREFFLRKFNREQLRMETSTGTPFKQMVAVGERFDKGSGKTERVTRFYPSYFNEVALCFKEFPIAEHFGLTVQTAMELPVNEWYEIRRLAEKLPKEKPPDPEIVALKQLVTELILMRVGGE